MLVSIQVREFIRDEHLEYHPLLPVKWRLYRIFIRANDTLHHRYRQYRSQISGTSTTRIHHSRSLRGQLSIVLRRREQLERYEITLNRSRTDLLSLAGPPEDPQGHQRGRRLHQVCDPYIRDRLRRHGELSGEWNLGSFMTRFVVLLMSLLPQKHVFISFYA